MKGLNTKFRWYKILLKDENLKPCTYYFRGITTKELRIAGTKEDKFEAEQYLLKKTVFPEKDWDNMLSGVVAKLLQLIYHHSGIDEDGITFNEAMNWIQSETGSLEAAAVAMIPSCTPDYLENADPYIYAKLLVLGKFQFESMSGIPVEQLFGRGLGSGVNNGIDPHPHPGPPAMPGPGEIGKQIENSFTWQRQK